MDARFSGGSFSSEQEDNESSPESQPGSPTQFASLSEITKAGSKTPPSHRKSRKATQKRVVSIPIKDSEGTRFKGEGTHPPSDSWAWRKYGQKPIKGSPYPRGYYRCSSSKGCPARKQVERSRDDPTMLVITYSCEHDHPWPVRKNNHCHQNHQNPPTTSSTSHEEEIPDNTNAHSSPEPESEPGGHEEKTAEVIDSGLGSPELDAADEFGWFMDMRTKRSTNILESPIYGHGYYDHHYSVKSEGKSVVGKTDVSMFFPMREEDESMFSDLGELPECTVLFRHGKNINNGVTQIS
ncbi:hypothetical protein MLD38_037101 [Melastoma candidum]|uniref:Uncharacterized protein n=1 Tax=Melastoma candidum TaxID=119954 RepID=A0ACB9LNK3_9MYRT|nr:hypothetical protein MLD38_037101 [Melastoma candidum]